MSTLSINPSLTINTNLGDKRSPYANKSPSTSESPISPSEILKKTCLLDNLVDISKIKISESDRNLTSNEFLSKFCPKLNYNNGSTIYTLGIILTVVIDDYNVEGLKIILTNCKTKFIISKLSENLIDNLVIIMENMNDLLAVLQTKYKTIGNSLLPIKYNIYNTNSIQEIKKQKLNNINLTKKECEDKIILCKHMINLKLNSLRTLSNYMNWADRHELTVHRLYKFAFLFDIPEMVLMIYKGLPCTRIQYPKLLEYTLSSGAYNCFKYFEFSFSHLLNISYNSLLEDLNKLNISECEKSNSAICEVCRYHFAYVIRYQILIDYLKNKLKINNNVVTYTEQELKIKEQWFLTK
jgi:hypothetical protein